MRKILAVFFLLLCGMQELPAKIRFFSFQFNRPDFLELQWQLLRKFILDDYELIVFNDAKDPALEESIRKTCEINNIQCVRYEQELHRTDPLNKYILSCIEDPQNKSDFVFDLENGHLTLEGVAQQSSIRHNHVIQYALDHFGYDHDDIVVLLDHDLFPIQPFSVREFLADVPIAGIEMVDSGGIRYLWVPFLALDPKRLPNLESLKFHCDMINHYFYDTGAHTYHYLKENPDVRYKLYRRVFDREFYQMSVSQLKEFGFNKEEIYLLKSLPWPGCIEFSIDYHFLHYGAGSADFHPIKQAAVLRFLEKTLKKQLD
jgi:hypothetical protein